MIHVSSLVVQVTPRGRAALLDGKLPPGARLHPIAAPSKLIVTLESPDEHAAADAAHALLQIPGVLTVALVAHLGQTRDEVYPELS